MKRSEMILNISRHLFKELKSSAEITESDCLNVAESTLDLIEYYDMMPPADYTHEGTSVCYRWEEEGT